MDYPKQCLRHILCDPVHQQLPGPSSVSWSDFSWITTEIPYCSWLFQESVSLVHFQDTLGYHTSLVGKFPQPGIHSDLPSSCLVPKTRDQEGSYFSIAKSGPFLRKCAQETSCKVSVSLGPHSPPLWLHGLHGRRRWHGRRALGKLSRGGNSPPFTKLPFSLRDQGCVIPWGGEGTECISQQTGSTEAHCTEVRRCYIPWSLRF